jgi:hypothetical protein
VKHRRIVLAPVMAIAFAASVAPLFAQNPPPKPESPRLAPFAPVWKKGDSWVVRTFLRDTTEETTGRPPTPPGPRLPGYPPLRGGAPEGFKRGNRWKLEVAREEDVKHEDDAKGEAPERFVVISLRALEGADARAAELWFTGRDLLLAKVVVAPGTSAEKATWLKGTVQLGVAAARELAFPLDWPDLLGAARREKIEAAVEGAPARVQEVKEETGSWLVTLGEKAKDAKRETRIRWKKDAPWWTTCEEANVLAELEEGGR